MGSRLRGRRGCSCNSHAEHVCRAAETSVLPPREVPLACELEALDGFPRLFPPLSKARAMAARKQRGGNGVCRVDDTPPPPSSLRLSIWMTEGENRAERGNESSGV